MQSLEDVPALFAAIWGINETAAQIILTIGVLMTVLIPVMMAARGDRAVTIEIVMIFVTLCLLVGIGWCPAWILIAVITLMAAAWAFLGSKVVSGE